MNFKVLQSFECYKEEPNNALWFEHARESFRPSNWKRNAWRKCRTAKECPMFPTLFSAPELLNLLELAKVH